jgi:protein phosphatase 1 regulatory subunit 12A
VPPARDEESETQRKAHAKRVRETRRSTQGVTLDEYKSAEEFVKKKNMNNNNSNSDNTTQSSEANDRVPSTNLTDEIVNPSVTATVIETINNPEPVTASYTITTAKSTKDKDSSDNSNENKISASYTISPPSLSLNKTPSPIDEHKEFIDSSPTITATINVPNSNSTIKTETDDINKIRTSNPQTNNIHTNNHNNINKYNKENSDQYNDNDNEKENDTSATIITNSNSNRYIRDKRSLFDIDNASSLSLAEKLRNEANKYNEVTTQQASDHVANNDNNDIYNNKKCDSSPSSPLHHLSAAERRPSWRLKFDAGNKFKLEDATSQNTSSSTPIANNNQIESSTIALSNTTGSTIAQRRPNNVTTNSTTTSRPVSAPVISTTISDDKLKHNSIGHDIALRRLKSEEDKENDKENDSRSTQATQSVIQRRKRPKRRSTGVVRLDKDELDPDRQESSIDGDEKESGSEISSRSRLGSTNSVQIDSRNHDETVSTGGDSNENGEFIDYKALWEASKVENDKLKIQLRKKDDELHSTKSALDRFTNATTKNSLSELEKRERRAMERKMSEMEEELKLLQKYKTENERLRAENRALTRVVAKLTTSAQNQLHKKQ